jgi:hypothetical protein
MTDGAAWTTQPPIGEVIAAAGPLAAAFAALASVPAVCDDVKDGLLPLLGTRPLGAAGAALAHVAGSVAAMASLLLLISTCAAVVALIVGAEPGAVLVASAQALGTVLLLSGAVVGWCVAVAVYLPRTALALFELAVAFSVLSAARAALNSDDSPGLVDLLTPFGQVEVVLAWGAGGGAVLGATGAGALVAACAGGTWLLCHHYRRRAGQ